VICGEFSNPVFPTMAAHIADRFAQRGLMTMVAIADERQNPEERCISEFIAAGVGAIVFLGGRHAEVSGPLGRYREVHDAGIPIVLVNGRATDLEVSHVRCDEGAGAALAARHLLRLGHTRIGCVIGPARYIPSVRMATAYREVLESAGVEVPDGAIVEAGFTFEAARAATARLVEQSFTGIITGNDLMALGAIHAVTRSGRSVPDDVSVVGYDGTDFTALSSPPLTTLRQPFEDMARLIAESVINELGGNLELRDHVVFEPVLVERNSTGPCRQRLEAVATR